MRTYIDHFEIESKRPGEAWRHVGNIYPDYKWEFRRLWLARRLVIIGYSIDAFIEAMERVTDMLERLPKSNERTRLVIWSRRRFLGLTRVGVLEQ